MKLRNRALAMTMAELMVVLCIFSLFLGAFYGIMEFGLKHWKIVEVQADLQTTAQWVMKRMTTELENASAIAIEASTPVDPNQTAYLSFEVPIYNGQFQSDPNTGNLIWQGHILYYTLPDPDDDGLHTRLLYRRYVPIEPNSPYSSTKINTPALLENLNNYLNTNPVVSCNGEDLKKICSRISKIKFENSGSIVNIELEFMENFRKSKDARVNFSSDNGVGTDKFVLKNSIKPKN